jgi:hypothetical protein
MLFRLPLIVALAFTAQVGMAQSVQWSLGTDPVRWASGFQNVQCGMQLHPEWGVVAGFGRMNGDARGQSSVFQSRPADYDMAWTGNIGLRLYPSASSDHRLHGLIGLDYSQEVYQRTIDLGPSASEGFQSGIYQHTIQDFRMLAGGRLTLSQHITLAAHLGVGYSVGPGRLASTSSAAPPSMSRLLGVELMWTL